MFAASTYEEIERIERQVENMEIVVFLFARPTEEKILKEFEYIHYNSARYCSIYAIGYTDDFTKAEDRTYRKVDAMMQQDWYFSMKAFTEFKEKLQIVSTGIIPARQRYSFYRITQEKEIF